MNYRHAHHAGNFADVLKHAVLLQLLAHATARSEPLVVLDTHAGAGMYALAEARTAEAAAGVARLMADGAAPEALAPLKRAVRAVGEGWYPGSPRLIADALRPRDRYVACELRAEEHARLAATLRGVAGAEALLTDGYAVVSERLPAGWRNAVVLIDPPYERGDEAARVAKAVDAVLARAPCAAVCVWAPLKDLTGFDALVGGVEAHAPLVVELRLRPPVEPLRLNGCALLLVNAPDAATSALSDIVGWAARTLSGEGASGRLWRP